MSETEFLTRVGLNISKLPNKKGFSQVELATRCGFDKSNLRRIEAGRTNPTVITLKKIAEALDIPIELLLKGTNISS